MDIPASSPSSTRDTLHATILLGSNGSAGREQSDQQKQARSISWMARPAVPGSCKRFCAARLRCRLMSRSQLTIRRAEFTSTRARTKGTSSDVMDAECDLLRAGYRRVLKKRSKGDERSQDYPNTRLQTMRHHVTLRANKSPQVKCVRSPLRKRLSLRDRNNSGSCASAHRHLCVSLEPVTPTHK